MEKEVALIFCSLLLCTVLSSFFTVPVQAQDQLELLLSPVADAYVNEAQPTSNYGATNSMYVGTRNANRNVRCFLYFNISTLPSDATILSANLSYRQALTSNILAGVTDQQIRRVSETWVENQLTWNNQPAMGDLITTIDVQADTRRYVDLTDYVSELFNSQTDIVSLGIKCAVESYDDTNRYGAINAKEIGTANSPWLLITYTLPIDTYTATLQSTSDKPTFQGEIVTIHINATKNGEAFTDYAVNITKNNALHFQNFTGTQFTALSPSATSIMYAITGLYDNELQENVEFETSPLTVHWNVPLSAPDPITPQTPPPSPHPPMFDEGDWKLAGYGVLTAIIIFVCVILVVALADREKKSG